MKKNDIFAYPHEIPFQGMPGGLAPKQKTYEEGMTLRDYFAGQALTGIVMHTGSLDIVVERCYLLADAMLKERVKE